LSNTVRWLLWIRNTSSSTCLEILLIRIHRSYFNLLFCCRLLNEKKTCKIDKQVTHVKKYIYMNNNKGKDWSKYIATIHRLTSVTLFCSVFCHCMILRLQKLNLYIFFIFKVRGKKSAQKHWINTRNKQRTPFFQMLIL
jgi:hypothetical protein